jgi:hypothetical protein
MEELYLDTGEGKKNCLSEAEYFLENWNDMLAGETFQSKLIEFTLEEAKAMTDYRDITRKAYYSQREGINWQNKSLINYK